MKRVEKYYVVENDAGEPCVGASGELLYTTKKPAETAAARNRKKFGERYAVATFVREQPLPKRATDDAAARATDRLIGAVDPNAVKSTLARGCAHVYRTVHGKNEGKPPPRLKRAKSSGRLVRGF
jgi:hypothetical protein